MCVSVFHFSLFILLIIWDFHLFIILENVYHFLNYFMLLYTKSMLMTFCIDFVITYLILFQMSFSLPISIFTRTPHFYFILEHRHHHRYPRDKFILKYLLSIYYYHWITLERFNTFAHNFPSFATGDNEEIKCNYNLRWEFCLVALHRRRLSFAALHFHFTIGFSHQ